MPYFTATMFANSDKNGTIMFRVRFGKLRVFVDGYDQSSPYVKTMWLRALRHVPKTANIQTVLMLGLAGGTAINEILRRFPGAQITVVEWDQVMIDIFHRYSEANRSITLLPGDITELLPKLEEQFDLVIVDLFKGEFTAETLAHEDTIKAIAESVKPQGFCLLNAFHNTSLLPAFGRYKNLMEHWKYQHNTLALYE